MGRSLDRDPGSLFAGEYRIERLLKKGGMGAVFVATQLSTGHSRALKLMHPALAFDDDMRRRFEQEARVGALIKSDHVVQVIGAGVDETSDTPWIAMELLEGEDLAARLDGGRFLSWSEARDVSAQLCHALGAAHSAGIVHRDLKPENVFLETPRREGARVVVKVLDFGIAKLLADVATKTTAAIGTPLWMAPEQTVVGGEITPATDVWALGLLVFQVLTGHMYWRAANQGSPSPVILLREIAVEPIEPASTRATELGVTARLPPDFDAWFARCVEREASKRFANAVEARAHLLPLLRDGGSDAISLAETAPASFNAPASRAPVTAPAPARRSKATLAIATLAALGAIGIVARALFSRPDHATSADIADTASKSSVEPTGADAATIADPLEDPLTVWRVPIDDNAPSVGPRDALVTIVEFSDFECPFGTRLDQTLAGVLPTYGDKIRRVWRDFPLAFHERSLPAAMVAREAFAEKGAAGFWKAHDLLQLSQAALDDQKLEAISLKLGLDPRAAKRAVVEGTYMKAEDDDTDIGDALRVDGTPITFINGRRIFGARSAELFRKTIDEEMARAEALLAGGVSRAGLAEAILNAGREAPSRKREPVADPKDRPVRGGPAETAVSIQEFCDFEEPFCGYLEIALRALRREYGDKIRLVWFDVPQASHAQARLAARAAWAALGDINVQKGDGRAFWAMHDVLLDRFLKPEEPTPLTRKDLSDYAAALKLDTATFDYMMAHGMSDESVQQGIAAAEKAGITSAPVLFIDGYRVRGGEPLHVLRKIIDQALAAKAKR